jgi:hypothetical protein
MTVRKHTTHRKALKSSRVKLVRPSHNAKKIRAAQLLADEIRKMLQPFTADQSLDKCMRQLRGRFREKQP